VEFSFVAVSGMLLLVGVADLGRALYDAMAIRQAAQAGALVALNWQAITSQCPNPCATNQVYAAIKASPSGIQIVDADIVLTPASAWSNDSTVGWRPNQEFTITVNHRFNFLSPVMQRTFLDLSTSITATRNP
jgi:hypothetical protein